MIGTLPKPEHKTIPKGFIIKMILIILTASITACFIYAYFVDHWMDYSPSYINYHMNEAYKIFKDGYYVTNFQVSNHCSISLMYENQPDPHPICTFSPVRNQVDCELSLIYLIDETHKGIFNEWKNKPSLDIASCP